MPDLILRQPTVEDLNQQYPVEIMPFTDSFSPSRQPSIVLETNQQTVNESKIRAKLEKLLIAFRLYQVGSVFSTREHLKPESVIKGGYTSFGNPYFLSTYTYGLGAQDLNHLQLFVEKIFPLIPLEAVLGRSKNIDPNALSIQRYQDAILKPEIIEGRLARAIMSLEALYLKAIEHGELSHRLGQRVGKLLSYFGSESIEVYSILAEAYEIRSRFIHGSGIESGERRRIGKLTKKVLNYSRQSIIAFLQLSQVHNKDEILSKIDKSLLNVKTSNRLEKLTTNCIVT